MNQSEWYFQTILILEFKLTDSSSEAVEDSSLKMKSCHHLLTHVIPNLFDFISSMDAK